MDLFSATAELVGIVFNKDNRRRRRILDPYSWKLNLTFALSIVVVGYLFGAQSRRTYVNYNDFLLPIKPFVEPVHIIKDVLIFLNALSLVIAYAAIFAIRVEHQGSMRWTILLMVSFMTMTALTMGYCLMLVWYNHSLLQSDASFLSAIKNYGTDVAINKQIDVLQKKFKCCGSKDYRDWTLNAMFQCRTDNRTEVKCRVPSSCCVCSDLKACPTACEYFHTTSPFWSTTYRKGQIGKSWTGWNEYGISTVVQFRGCLEIIDRIFKYGVDALILDFASLIILQVIYIFIESLVVAYLVLLQELARYRTEDVAISDDDSDHEEERRSVNALWKFFDVKHQYV